MKLAGSWKPRCQVQLHGSSSHLWQQCEKNSHKSNRFTIVEYCGWLQQHGPMPNGGNTSSLWKAKLAFKFHSQKHHRSEGLRFSCHSWPQESRTGWQWLSSLSAKNGHTLKRSIEQGGLNRTALARNTYRIACALIICFYCAVHVTKTMKRRKNMIRLESAWAKPQSITSSHFVVPDAVLHLQFKIFRWSSLISHNFTAEILTSSEIKTYFTSAWYDIRNCFDDWLNFLNPGHVLHNKHNRRLKRIFFVFGCWLWQRWPVKKKT
jgi:hypothetical protein